MSTSKLDQMNQGYGKQYVFWGASLTTMCQIANCLQSFPGGLVWVGAKNGS